MRNYVRTYLFFDTVLDPLFDVGAAMLVVGVGFRGKGNEHFVLTVNEPGRREVSVYPPCSRPCAGGEGEC